MPYHINEELSDVIFEVDGDKVAFKVPIPASGIGSDEMWNLLGKEGSEQIDISHIKDALDTYFEGELPGDSYLELDENGNVRVKEGRNFYTEGELSAGGFSSESSGGDTGTGIDETKLWQILGTPGTQQIDASHLQTAFSKLMPDLSNYVTSEALANTLQSYATSDALNAHASDTNLHLSEEDREKLSWFAKDEQGNIYIKGGLNFYTEGEISAGGYSDEGGTEPGGTGIDETQLWQILGNSGTEQIAKNHLTTALSDYITTSSANSLFATKTELSNYATSSDLAQTNANVTAISTKLDDFLEGSDTDTIINKWKELEAFLSGMSESDNLADILSNKADTAWTEEQLGYKLDKTVFDDLFEKVLISEGKYAIRAKYDFYSEGEISAGGYSDEGGGTGVGSLLGIKVNGSTYEPVDGYITIPDYPTELAWGSITGKPTTLAGYGITDAYTKAESDSRYVNTAGDTMTGNLSINGTTYIPIEINSSDTTKSVIAIKSNGVQKNVVGWTNEYGSYIYDTDTNKYVNIKSDSLYWNNQYPFLHTGNYTSTLDTRYVLKSGDTMTGVYILDGALQKLGVYTFFSRSSSTPGIYFATNDNGNLDISGHSNFNYTKTFAVLNYQYNKIDIYQPLEAYSTLKVNGNTVWHAGNDGAGSGLDADLLDGVHNGYLTANKLYTAGSFTDFNTLTGNGIYAWSTTTKNRPANYGTVFQFSSVNTPVPGSDQHWVNQFAWSTDDRIFVRQIINASSWSSWHTLAYLTDNVASATKLQTARTIWGQSFDGQQDIYGDFHIYTTSGSNYGYIKQDDISYNISRLTIGTCYGYSAEVDALTIYNGRIGIGSPSPAYKLHVEGDIYTSSILRCANYLAAGNSTFGGGAIELYGSTPYIDFHFNNSSADFTSRLIEKSSGTLTCEKNFHVGGTFSVSATSIFSGTIRADGTYIFITNTAGGQGIYLVPEGISAHSNYGYTKSIMNFDLSTGATTLQADLSVTGNIVATGEITAGSTSDARLKTILGKQDYAKRLLDLGMIVDYEYNDLAFSRNVRSIERRAYTGLIYQNVKNVLPQMAGEDADGYGYLNYIHTDYINLIAGALQQTILKQETIEQRVARLERENAELKQKISKLVA